MKRRLAQILLTLAILVAARAGLQQLNANRAFREAPSIEAAEEALKLDSQNPDALYRIGMAYREQIELWDLSRSVSFLERAVTNNPYNWRYRLELGRALELGRQFLAAEGAYRQALELNPRDPTYLWRMGNFLVRQDRVEEAFTYLMKSAEFDPQMAGACLNLLWKLDFDEERVLQEWPREREPRLLLLESLLRRGSERAFEFADAIWAELMTSAKPLSVSEVTPYLRSLVDRRQIVRARVEWFRAMERLGMADHQFADYRNAVWWGEFERTLPGGLFGWHLENSSSVSWDLASGEGRDGSDCVKVRFHNLDGPFRGLGQRLLLAGPGTYQMTFTARSDSLTTEQGIYLELVDVGDGRIVGRTDQVVGSTQWKTYTRLFTLAEEPQFLQIRFRRDPSRKIDSALNGEIWIDSVWVEPIQISVEKEDNAS